MPHEPHAPLWMIYASFIVTVILALLKLRESFPRPTLEVQLTRDIFFRLVEVGEALFCNAALIATHRPVLITRVEPVLRRLAKSGRNQKTFELDVLNFGEKVRGSQNVAEHHFFGSSPLQYVNNGAPLRAVYLCVYADYAEKQRRAYESFQSDVRSIGDNNRGADLSDPEQAERIESELEAKIERHLNNLLQLSQIEVGEYELVVKVHYRNANGFSKNGGRNSSSRIKFTIEEQPVEALRASLRQSLIARARNILEGSAANNAYPELLPTGIREEVDIGME